MRVSRVFVDTELAPGQLIAVTGQRAHYLRNVLRVESNQPLVLFNGQGGEYTARAQNISKKEVVVEVLEYQAGDRTASLQIELGMAMIKRDNFDLAIQKATELGISKLTPLLTDNVSIARGDLNKRQSHWRGVIVSAAEQCGLNRLPDLQPPVRLEAWSEDLDGARLFGMPGGSALPGDNPTRVNLLIGPEGGLSDREHEFLEQSEFVGINLGPRILRAETAAISLLSLVHSRWGDFRG